MRAAARVAVTNETVNTNNKSKEPVKILCVIIFCNPFQQLFFQTLHWQWPSAGLSTCAREEKKGVSQHFPRSKTAGS
jgi:hypothetical protein